MVFKIFTASDSPKPVAEGKGNATLNTKTQKNYKFWLTFNDQNFNQLHQGHTYWIRKGTRGNKYECNPVTFNAQEQQIEFRYTGTCDFEANPDFVEA